MPGKDIKLSEIIQFYNAFEAKKCLRFFSVVVLYNYDYFFGSGLPFQGNFDIWIRINVILVGVGLGIEKGASWLGGGYMFCCDSAVEVAVAEKEWATG